MACEIVKRRIYEVLKGGYFNADDDYVDVSNGFQGTILKLSLSVESLTAIIVGGVVILSGTSWKSICLSRSGGMCSSLSVCFRKRCACCNEFREKSQHGEGQALALRGVGSEMADFCPGAKRADRMFFSLHPIAYLTPCERQKDVKDKMHGLMMNCPLTIARILEHAHRIHGDKQVTTWSSDAVHRYTYAEFYRRVQRLANVLIQRGVRPGGQGSDLRLEYVSALGALLCDSVHRRGASSAQRPPHRFSTRRDCARGGG